MHLVGSMGSHEGNHGVGLVLKNALDILIYEIQGVCMLPIESVLPSCSWFVL